MNFNKLIILLHICITFFLIGCQSNNSEKIYVKGTPEYKGYELYKNMACNACHTLDGNLKLGPSFKGQYGKEILHTDGSEMIVDENYIYESITDPLKYIVEGYTPIMPSYKPILSDEDISNIIAYIKTLK